MKRLQMIFAVVSLFTAGMFNVAQAAELVVWHAYRGAE